MAFARERRGAKGVESAAPAAPAPRFDLVHVLYYAGALLVIGALGLLADAAFEQFGGWALTAIALVYGAGFLWLGRFLWNDPETRAPGGLCVAVAVATAPVALYGVLVAVGFAPAQPALTRIAMETAAIVAAALAMRRFAFSFILLIAGLAVWMLAMDVAVLVAHGPDSDWDMAWDLRRMVTQAVGLVMILAGWAIDLRNVAGSDFGFWPHALGSAALWGGATLAGDPASPAYCALNVALIAFGVFVFRRIYALFGGIGVAIYLGALAFSIIPNTIAFALTLSVIGIAVVLAGLALEWRSARVSAWLNGRLPASFRALRPAHARHA